MLKGKGITKRFGGLVALNGLDFQLGKSEIVGLIGPNGSGKTTLFNLISGFHLPDSGSILLKGKRINGMKPYRIAQLGIGRTFQIVRPLPDLTTLENVSIGVLYGRKGGRNMERARAKGLQILEFTGLAAKRDVLAMNLPLVDRKRLEVARALATQPILLLLDEVFAGLNQVEIEKAIDLVIRIHREFHVTIFMIEHVMKAIMRTCHRIIAIHHGEKISEGSPEGVANDPHVIEAYLGSTYAENIGT
jgi:branched-chain amino acid transport system ATP-binding protein